VRYTHQKRPYKATCTQFLGGNMEQVLLLLNNDTTDAHKYGEDCIMVRFNKPQRGRRDIETLVTGWWVVIGENEVVKCYDDATFRIKYKELT